MATLQKRGSTWRAQIRRKGYPAVRARDTLTQLAKRSKHISGRVFSNVTNSAISHKFRGLCRDLEIEGLR